MSYLKKFNILYEHRFGFKEGKSTEQAIIDLQSNIIQAIEKKNKACSISFAKVFDTLNHEILLSKLEYHSIRDIPLLWFKSYLSNRQRCVKVSQSIAKTKSITYGVPQRSVFGPLFFYYILMILMLKPQN